MIKIVVLASLRGVFTARRRIGPIDGGLGPSGVRRVLASATLLISRGAVKLTGPHTQLTPTGQDVKTALANLSPPVIQIH